MTPETFAVRIAKDYKEITVNEMMDLMSEEGLHPDDDSPDVEQALEGEGVKVIRDRDKWGHWWWLD